jgi:hypothetical protein
MFKVILITDIRDYMGGLEFDPSQTGNGFFLKFFNFSLWTYYTVVSPKDIPVLYMR